MSFGISGRSIPCITGYTDALRRWESITPIRGRSEDVRPLEARSKTHLRLVRPDDKSVACRLYGTNVVTFYKDGEIEINLGGYATQTTYTFISAILRHLGCAHSTNGTPLWTTRSGSYLLPVDGTLVLDSTGEPINPTPCTIHKVNRKAMSLLRKQYAGFITYAIGICKLLEGKLENQWIAYPPHIHELMLSPVPEDQYRAVTALMARNMTWTYYGRECRPSRLEREITKLLITAHRDEVLIKETLPLGVYKKDNYASEKP